MAPYTFHSLLNLRNYFIIITIYKFIIIIHLQISLIIYIVLLSFFRILVIIHLIIIFQFTLVSYACHIRVTFHFYINRFYILQIGIVASRVFFHLN
jgi:hypothetical protein